jgi:hypothetical protein
VLNSIPLLKVAGTVVVKPVTRAQNALLTEKTAGKAVKPDTLGKCATATASRRIRHHPLKQDALDWNLNRQPKCQALEH